MNESENLRESEDESIYSNSAAPQNSLNLINPDLDDNESEGSWADILENQGFQYMSQGVNLTESLEANKSIPEEDEEVPTLSSVLTRSV